MRRLSVLVPLVLSLSCGDDAPDKPASLTARGGRLYDATGREVLFHGVNARVEGLFDVTFDDGRVPLEEIPPFTEDDCRFLGEELGLNHLRLPVNWSGIEPHDDEFRAEYVQHIVDLAAACHRHGVETLVDFHQDAYSKEIGEDGAPLFAIQPPPTMLLEGPLDDLNARRASAQVGAAFLGFFENQYDGWAQFGQMARYVAARIDGKPGILGLEIYNEPYLFFQDDTLVQFHQQITADIRAVAPNLTVFFEPAAVRNVVDVDAADPPFARPNAVYAPHIYTDVFENGWASEDVSAIEASVAGARAEATTHGAALYVGEFGNGTSARGVLYGHTTMRVFDDELASWAFWLYEEYSQGSWGLYEPSGTTPPTRGTLRAEQADLLARAFPTAVDGHLETVGYDVATKTLTVTLSAAGTRPHRISTPRRTYPNGVVVTCDGAPVTTTTPMPGRIDVVCAGTTLIVRPPT